MRHQVPKSHGTYDGSKNPPHDKEWMTAENLNTTRNDIQNFLDVGTPLPKLATILLGRGLNQNEVDKIMSDLPSYN